MAKKSSHVWMKVYQHFEVSYQPFAEIPVDIKYAFLCKNDTKTVESEFSGYVLENFFHSKGRQNWLKKRKWNKGKNEC